LTKEIQLTEEASAYKLSGGYLRVGKKTINLRTIFFENSGLIPFYIFSIIFIAVPTLTVMILAFRGNSGEWTFGNIRFALSDIYLDSLIGSLRLGFTSAIVGSIAGLIFAYGIVISGYKRLQRVVSTASGVFANTGGVPLAFFFIAAIGNYGVLTLFLQKIGIDIYAGNFSLSSFTGLVVVYLYFQIPLMLIVIYPAIDGLKNEWREAAANLGASKIVFWRMVGIPILTPAYLGAFLLLFANAFAAYATANVLTVGTVALLPIQIGSNLQGDVVADQTNVGMAMGLEMIVIVAIAMSIYVYLDRKTSKWRKV